MLSEELGSDPEGANSTFRLFLKYCPDALVTLFDRCLISECTQEDNENVSMDLFLFKCGETTECETDIINVIYESGRRKLLDHPIFEILIKLKWERSLKLFSLLFLHALLLLQALFLFLLGLLWISAQF